MITMMVPVLFVLVGAALYYVAANPHIKELGRLLFAAGAFALAFTLAGKVTGI